MTPGEQVCAVKKMFGESGVSLDCSSTFENSKDPVLSQLPNRTETTVLKDDAGYSAIYYAISEGHLRILEELIQRNPHYLDPNHYRDWTPLHHAAFLGELDAVRILLEQEALFEKEPVLLNSQDLNGQTAFTISIKHDNVELFKFLLQQQELRKRVPMIGSHFLRYALCFRSMKIVRYFLEQEPSHIKLLYRRFVFDAQNNTLSCSSVPFYVPHISKISEEDADWIIEYCYKHKCPDILPEYFKTAFENQSKWKEFVGLFTRIIPYNFRKAIKHSIRACSFTMFELLFSLETPSEPYSCKHNGALREIIMTSDRDFIERAMHHLFSYFNALSCLATEEYPEEHLSFSYLLFGRDIPILCLDHENPNFNGNLFVLC